MEKEERKENGFVFSTSFRFPYCSFFSAQNACCWQQGKKGGEKKRKRRGRKIFVPDPIFGFPLSSPSPPSFAAPHKGDFSSSPSRGKRERKECNVVCITSLPLLLTCYFFFGKSLFLFCRGKSVGKKVWKSLLLLADRRRRPCLNNPDCKAGWPSLFALPPRITFFPRPVLLKGKKENLVLIIYGGRELSPLAALIYKKEVIAPHPNLPAKKTEEQSRFSAIFINEGTPTTLHLPNKKIKYATGGESCWCSPRRVLKVS